MGIFESAALIKDSCKDGAPKVLRDLGVAYELMLDHKHTRLCIMEVARAIREAASSTPPAFSPKASQGTTPGGGHTVAWAARRGVFDCLGVAGTAQIPPLPLGAILA
jgi:hypothetical protein